MTIPHLDLQIEYLTAIKAGKRMEWRWRWDVGLAAEWHEWESSTISHPLWGDGKQYEIREVPRQQYIPECDVPRALEVEPKFGTGYWTFDLNDSPCVVQWYWDDDEHDAARLEAGLCFATEADARAAWEAMTARRERS